MAILHVYNTICGTYHGHITRITLYAVHTMAILQVYNTICGTYHGHITRI